MRITREDVAREAGVSASTVSYVLNNSRQLSENTVCRVHEAVERLGYKPDMIARSMVKSSTHQLAVALDSILNPYYSEIVLGFENAAIKNGYFVNVCSGQNNLDGYFETFISRRIDGLFILALPDKYSPQKIYSLVDSGIAVVSGGIEDIDLKKVSLITSNYGEGMKLALEHLYALGHRRIAYLTTLSGTETSDMRAEAYRQFLRDKRLDYGGDLIFHVDSAYSIDIEDGYHSAKKMLESGKAFTAVICVNDLMAIGAITAIREAGLCVPDDISVVGFDNIIYAQHWSPSITSVTHDKQEFGARAFELLHSNITQNITGYFQASVHLSCGASTAAANTDRLAKPETHA